jgi:hypothetical protein
MFLIKVLTETVNDCDDGGRDYETFSSLGSWISSAFLSTLIVIESVSAYGNVNEIAFGAPLTLNVNDDVVHGRKTDVLIVNGSCCECDFVLNSSLFLSL